MKGIMKSAMGLAALAAASGFGDIQRSSALMRPSEIVLPTPSNRPKDKRDKKRKKSLRSFFRGIIPRHKVERTFNQHVKFMQAREKAIGLPPKYRNQRARQVRISDEGWESLAKQFAVDYRHA